MEAMPAERIPPADDSLLVHPLLAVTEWTLRAPATILASAVALALLAIAISVNGLSFKSSRLDLLNPRSEYNRRWLAYLTEFGTRDDAVVVVRADQRNHLTTAIDDLATQLRQEPQLFESVFYRRDLTQLKGKALHYLSPEDLSSLEKQISQAAALMPPQGQPADPVSQLAALNDRLAHIATATSDQRAEIEAQYARTAGTLLASFNTPLTTPHSPATAFSALTHFDPQYLLADEGRLGFILLRLVTQPGESAPNSAAIARLRGVIRQTQTNHPAIWIGLTGMPVIEHDEMQASQFDMLWTSIFSMGLVLLLYLASYGGLRHAILVNILLLLATAYSFGFVTLAVGHLNILSAAFSAVLIGLGIDFAIHYVASYLHLRQQGCDEETALVRTAVEVGPGVVTGGVTTAAAFFMAAMTDFIGVRELGLVAGGGILLCVLTTVVVLPPLILLVDRRWPLARVPAILPAGHWFQLSLLQPRMVVAACVAATLVLAVGIGNLRYDHNLLNLQPRHLESADIERELLSHLDDSVWYAVSVCSTRQELREKKAQFEKLPVVSKTEEVASLLPDHAPKHAQRIAALCRQLSALPVSPPTPTPVNLARLKSELARAKEHFSGELPYETPATGLLARLQGAITAASSEQVESRLTQGSAAMMTQVLAAVSTLRGVADPVPPHLDDLPRELTDRLQQCNENKCAHVEPSPIECW
jgi:hypothetical protein